MNSFLESIFTYNPEAPMLFNSGLFWVLFILFIPIFGLIRHRKTTMMVYVTIFSLFFYYKSSGLFCILLFVRALTDYLLAKWINVTENKAGRKWLLATSILLSVATLGYFKYSNFILLDVATLFGGNFQPLDLILPVGISFYTFQSISYVVDVYKRRTGQAESFLEYLFFLSFFPQLVAGPIVRSSVFLPQIYNENKITDKSVFSGMVLIMIGLVKKAIVADYIAQFNNMVFANTSGYSGFECMIVLFGFSVQIFCDFSGYSDIAIGLSRIMGFELGDNFRSPFKSLNISEFWRRWHISLSSWLRDYIYIPLGGNRKGKVRTYINLFITMLVGGIWHGAGWHFIIWGGMHGLALVAHKLKRTIAPVNEIGRARQIFSILCTFLFVTSLWGFFRCGSATEAAKMMMHIFTDFQPEMIIPFVQTRTTWFIVLLLAFVAIFLPLKVYQWAEKVYINSHIVVKLLIFIALVQVILEFSNTEVSPFIYFQF